MPWVDGPNNKWRVTIIPLAMQCPALFFAVLALSAEHQSKKTSVPANAGTTQIVYYRDKSLALLAEDLRQEVLEGCGKPPNDRRSGILASILILCQLEMIQTDGSLWHTHRGAARTIAASWTARIQDMTAMDDTSRFLVKEAFVFDVFASSTTFDCESYVSASLVHGQDDYVFIDFLRLVQQVTQAERASHNGVTTVDPSVTFEDVESVRRAFEYTRQRNLELGKHIHCTNDTQREDFNKLIDIYHYAGVLYSSQALGLLTGSTARQKEDCASIIAKINQIGGLEHDLVWPVFIVGTQARELPEYQHFTETRLRQDIDSTGFGNGYPALMFLQRFWATDAAVTRDWLAYARQESQRGVRFLVI